MLEAFPNTKNARVLRKTVALSTLAFFKDPAGPKGMLPPRRHRRRVRARCWLRKELGLSVDACFSWRPVVIFIEENEEQAFERGDP